MKNDKPCTNKSLSDRLKEKQQKLIQARQQVQYWIEQAMMLSGECQELNIKEPTEEKHERH